jgi:3-hydroxybutyryl-CoA dehydrogenase
MANETISVVGTGRAGRNIAQAIALAGMNVILVDVEPMSLRRGMEFLGGSLRRLVEQKRLRVEEGEATLSRIQTCTDYRSVADTDVVFEAASDNAEIKVRILCEIERCVRGDAIIATNTSSISVTTLGAALRNPARLVGVHFFDSSPLLPLAEVRRGLRTDRGTELMVRDLILRLGKSPVGSQRSLGSGVNRIIVLMINEAFLLLSEGAATAEEVDAGIKSATGFPLGPLALADFIGLDVCLSALDQMFEESGDTKYRAASLLRASVSAGGLGPQSRLGIDP